MTWDKQYPQTAEPALKQIAEYIASPLWPEVTDHAEKTYGVRPQTEYSLCSGAPGWNVKYKKSGRSLCTLYPHEGFFTCLICIGSREMLEAELVLTACSPYVQELYQKARPFNGTRWLMIDVTSRDILEDVKSLLHVRAGQKRRQNAG